jgi:glycerophosphoryl diester phosphodiesterase
MNEEVQVEKGSPLLIHHMANGDHDHPPNSLAALRYCLEAGARVIEVDVNPLREDDFALLHDDLLENATDGSGLVAAATPDEVRAYRYTHRDAVTEERVALLSDALEVIQDYAQGPFQELQLDFKISPDLSDETLNRFVQMVEPVKGLVRVTCPADWVLRQLRALDPELPQGFDPLLYIEVFDTGEEIPPFRQGAYGYWDDHPLGTRRWGTTAEYLAARAEALLAQAPDREVWYIHAWVLDRVLDDGFDWIDYLHRRSILVDAWTLDVGKPRHVELARRFMEAGVDRLTTNTAPQLAAALDDAPRF